MTAAETVMDAAIDAGVARIVHVSTVNAFGDTGYRVVDETYARPQPYRYVSVYDETKHRAHLAAARSDRGRRAGADRHAGRRVRPGRPLRARRAAPAGRGGAPAGGHVR